MILYNLLRKCLQNIKDIHVLPAPCIFSIIINLIHLNNLIDLEFSFSVVLVFLHQDKFHLIYNIIYKN